MYAGIRAIEYALPEASLTNEALAAEHPEWSVGKIEGKTGIAVRYIAASDECSSDLAVAAAHKLFGTGACRPDEVDFLLLCTQSPDYFLPTTACIVQDRLGIPVTAGALDFNLGCSGFVYGLGLAKGLIETGQARNVLLLTAETYSKYIHPSDRSVRTLFGDAAAATLIGAVEPEDVGAAPAIGPLVFGTDGRGAANLIVPCGGMRSRHPALADEPVPGEQASVPTPNHLYMNGPEIFNFTLRAVPECVDRLLERAGKALADIDLFVFHQANRYMLEHLRRKIGIPEERFVVAMRHCGNTVSSTIPIALHDARLSGTLRPGQLVMLVGFGVGYSWGGALVRWTATAPDAGHGCTCPAPDARR